ncbi:MAG: ATP-binding protein [Clostridia bacterium]|nr:ATP-binding protein [Clostridia bacterium]
MSSDKYTFDNFVDGRSTRFAVAACREITKSPCNLNPIWVYGPTGCGKTHLLRAVCHGIQSDERYKAIYLSCDDVERAMIESLKVESPLWKDILECDALIVDDIDCLSGKPMTQIEFFKLILKKCAKDQRVLISSVYPPKHFLDLTNNIKSNIEMALFADMGFPDFQQRVGFVEQYAADNGIDLSEETVNYIADSAFLMSKIKGQLNKLHFWAAEHGNRLNSECVKSILKRF